MNNGTKVTEFYLCTGMVISLLRALKQTLEHGRTLKAYIPEAGMETKEDGSKLFRNICANK